MNVKELRKNLKNISNQLEDDLFTDPYLFITETDFQVWLYNQLNLIHEFKTPFHDYLDEPVSKIHLEYPRFREDGNKLKKQGRYDIVILRKPKKGSIFDTQYRKNILMDYFPSYLAFELKAKWNLTTNKVLEKFSDDIGAFKKNTRHLGSDYGVLFHLNLAKHYDQRCEYTRIQKSMNRHKKKYPHVFLIYLESYHSKDNRPPKVLYTF